MTLKDDIYITHGAAVPDQRQCHQMAATVTMLSSLGSSKLLDGKLKKGRRFDEAGKKRGYQVRGGCRLSANNNLFTVDHFGFPKLGEMKSEGRFR